MAWEDDIKTEYMGPGSKMDTPADGTVVFERGVDVRQPRPGVGPSPSCVLVRERTGEQLQVVPPTIVGRGAQATTKVRGNLAISRNHVRIQKTGDKYTITDLGSVNGTRVRGMRIPPNVEVEVNDGDEIGLASERFWLQIR